MKTSRIASLLWIGILTVTVGCKERKGESAAYFNISPPSITFSYDETASPKTVEVITDASSFSYKTLYGNGDGEWLDIAREETALKISPKNINTESKERKAVILVSVPHTESKHVSVTQESLSSITLEFESLVFEPAGKHLTHTCTVKTTDTGLRIAEPENLPGWADCSLQNDLLTVSVKENTGAERSVSLLITNDRNAQATLTVTQKDAREARTIVLEPATLTFGAESSTALPVSVKTAGTLSYAKADEASAEWLSAELRNGELLVTVTDNMCSRDRSGSVAVGNAEGYESLLSVNQKGTEVGDISGTWNYSCISKKGTGSWDGAETLSGTVTVSKNGEDGYIIEGIAGSALNVPGIVPRITVQMKNGKPGVVDAESFTIGNTTYRSGISLALRQTSYVIYTGAFAELTVDSFVTDGTEYDRITFPSTVEATAALLPDDPAHWGETATVTYVYYSMRMGMWEQTAESYRNVVLTRKAG